MAESTFIRLLNRLDALTAVAKAYEQWEADLILDREAWSGGTADLPTLTWPLWDRLLEIQAMRNKALKDGASPPSGDDLCSSISVTT